MELYRTLLIEENLTLSFCYNKLANFGILGKRLWYIHFPFSHRTYIRIPWLLDNGFLVSLYMHSAEELFYGLFRILRIMNPQDIILRFHTWHFAFLWLMLFLTFCRNLLVQKLIFLKYHRDFARISTIIAFKI